MESDKEAQPTSSSSKYVATCDLCSLPIKDVKLKYKCSTCEETTSSSDPNVNFCMCEMCIISHTRRKHDVLDYKQMKVVVCEQHLVCCSSFCEDCDRLICTMCVQQHAVVEKHEVIPMELKANAIKWDIHEAISEVDEEYKPIVKRLENAEQFSDQVAKISSSSKSGQQNIYDQMLEIFNESLGESGEKMKTVCDVAASVEKTLEDTVKMYEGIRDSLESKQSKMRDLLSLSDARLVKQFNPAYLNTSKHELSHCNDSAVRCLYDANTLLVRARLNLKNSFRRVIDDFTEELVGVLDSIVENGKITGVQPQNLPEDSSFFVAYRNCHVQLASSDSHLCIAHSKENDRHVLFELFDRNGQKSTTQLVEKVDMKFFRMFSCFAGIVFQVDEKGFSAFKTINEKVEHLNRWEVSVSSISGFYFDNGAFYYHSSTVENRRWTLKFESTAFAQIGPCQDGYSPFVSCQLSSEILYMSLWDESVEEIKTCSLFIHSNKSCAASSSLKSIGTLDLSKLQPVKTFVTFESVNNQTVAVACSISEQECKFAYKQIIDDTFDLDGQTYFKSVAIKSVHNIQFFNCDCYFSTKEGAVIHHKNFFTEL